MFGLNIFRSTLIFLFGLAAWYYMSADRGLFVQRGKRAPISERGTTDVVIFPARASQLARGASYDIRFTCSVPLEYVNIDVYVVQGQQTYVQYLATRAPAPTGTSGSIKVQIPTNIQTGPSFVLKVWGPRADGIAGHYEVPDSDHFAIVDPYAGSFNNPGLAQEVSLFTGRQATLDYTLGSAFDGVKSIRLDLLNADWHETYTILDGIQASGTQNATYTWTWQVPASLRLSQFYHLRITPSGSALAPRHSVNQSAVTTAVLSSPEFSIFPVPAMNDPAMTLTLPKQWINNESVSIGWSYQPYPAATVGQWNIDLYSTALANPQALGVYLGTVANNANGGKFQWAVPLDLPSGTYFVRVWGYKTGQQAGDNVDPVSKISDPITVLDKATASDFSLAVSAPKTWTRTRNVTLSWTYTSNLPVSGWYIDLYKNSLTYKLYTPIVSAPLPASSNSYTVQVPADWDLGYDFTVNVRTTVTTKDGIREVGAFSTAFSVVEAPDGSDKSSASTTSRSRASGSASITPFFTNPPTKTNAGIRSFTVKDMMPIIAGALMTFLVLVDGFGF